MDTFDDHLTWMESTTGPEFAAAIQPGGVLRDWVVQHLADEMGEDPDTAEAAVDVWLEDHGGNAPIDGDPGVLRLDDRIEMLLERQRLLDDVEDEVEIAFLEKEIGTMLADVGRPLDALARFMTAREAFVSFDFDLDAGVCDMETAMAAKDLGWHEASRRSYERARPLIAMYGTVGDFARLLANQANLERAVGSADEAVMLHQQARWLAWEAREIRPFAASTHNLANIASDRGDFEAAIELFTEARNIYVDIDDPVSAADCDRNAGSAMIDDGHYDDGLDMARQALAVYVDHGQPIETAHARRTIAHALDHLGRHDDAVTELGYARDAYSSASLLPQAAACDVDVSYTLRSLGRFDEARAAVLRVQDAYREIGFDADDPWFGDTLAAIGRGEVDRHEHPITDDGDGDR